MVDRLVVVCILSPAMIRHLGLFVNLVVIGPHVECGEVVGVQRLIQLTAEIQSTRRVEGSQAFHVVTVGNAECYENNNKLLS